MYFQNYTGSYNTTIVRNGTTVINNGNAYPGVNPPAYAEASHGAGYSYENITVDKTTSKQTKSYTCTAK